jgi:hypothetical protein
MRITVLVATLVATPALGAAAWAQTTIHPYHVAATQACLVRHGVPLVSPTRPQYAYVVGVLEWRPGRAGDIQIVFAASPARAIVLRQQVKQVALTFGATLSEIRRGVLRIGNAVVYPSLNHGWKALTPRRLATIRHCLR